MYRRLLGAITAIALSASGAPHGNQYTTTSNGSIVNQTACNGNFYTYNGLVGYGSVPANARDKFGDTLGGYGSAIAIEQTSWTRMENGTYTGTLWAVPDRGWNTEGTLNFQNRVHRFAILFTPQPAASLDKPAPANLDIVYQDSILLTGPDNVPTTGLDADVAGYQTSVGFPPLPLATYDGDGFGGSGPGGSRVSLDTEGLVLAPDGSFWISDEYGPMIYHFSSQGAMLSAISPPDAFIPRRNGSISFSSDTPPIYSADEEIEPENPTTGRANNQGFEGLSLSPDGKTLNALLQSALDQDGGGTDSGRRYTRLLQHDISNDSCPELLSEYVVPLPFYTTSKGNQKVAAQSEIHALSSSQFLILARDSGKGYGQGKSDTESLYRRIDVFDVSAGPATDIKNTFADFSNGSIASANGTLAAGIVPATYCSSFVDFNVNSELGRFGLHNGGEEDGGLLNEKWESIAIVPVDPEAANVESGSGAEVFVFSFSDNDFVTQDGYMNFGNYRYKDSSGYDVSNQALVFRVMLPELK